ncbi:MAG: c-type cytochrome [Gemmatimonadales bacterium]
MKRALKWLGYIVGGFVVVVLLAVGTIYALSSSRMARTYPTKVETVPIPTGAASLERGKHLVVAVGKCQNCHGDNFAGKLLMDAPVFARLSSANLTAGKGGIGNSYTDADYVRSIRYGVGKDGKPLIFMPAEAYYHFNDSDLGAIIAYLRTLPPTDSQVPKAKQIGPIARMIFLAGVFPLVPAEKVPRDTPRPTPIAEGVTPEYGNYLVSAGGCKACHGDNLAGGSKIEGVLVANLTPAGEVGKWTEADFAKALRTGVKPNGKILSAVMPWPYMKDLTDDEIRAMWMYIHSVAPVTPPK